MGYFLRNYVKLTEGLPSKHVIVLSILWGILPTTWAMKPYHWPLVHRNIWSVSVFMGIVDFITFEGEQHASVYIYIMYNIIMTSKYLCYTSARCTHFNNMSRYIYILSYILLYIHYYIHLYISYYIYISLYIIIELHRSSVDIRRDISVRLRRQVTICKGIQETLQCLPWGVSAERTPKGFSANDIW